jgi:4-amino-4-deoxy-L-arabinose transferase-like glycosyltransferase
MFVTPPWVLTQSWLFVIALVILIGLSLLAYRYVAKKDIQKFIWTQVISVSATILGVFIAAVLALSDRENAERTAAAAALAPYGTSSLVSQFNVVNKWLGYAERFQDDGKHAEIQEWISASLSNLRPLDAFSKITENEKVSIHLDNNEIFKIQNYRIADEATVSDIKRLNRPEDFCKRLNRMRDYLEILAKYWTALQSDANQVVNHQYPQQEFGLWYTSYIKMLQDQEKTGALDEVPHYQDDLKGCPL